MKKVTKGEVRRRVDQVAKLIIFGAEFADIRQYASETDVETKRPWGIGDRQLCEYQRRAYALIEAQAEKTRDRVWARHVQQRRQMFALAMNAGDLGTALSIAKDEADLHGLYPTTGQGATPLTVNVNTAVQVNANPDPTTNARRIAEALALLDAARARAIPIADGAAQDAVHGSPAADAATTPIPRNGLP